MKWLLLLIISSSVFAQPYFEKVMRRQTVLAFTCSQGGAGDFCRAMLGPYDSAVTLKHTVSLLSSARFIKKQIEADKELVELRELEASNYIKNQEKEFFYAFKVSMLDQKGSLGYYRRWNSINKKLLRKAFGLMNEKYEEYFVRYLRILKRDIPWDRIQEMEKGFTLGQMINSLHGFASSKKASMRLVKRLKLQFTWRDVATEAVAYYFKNKLYKNNGVHNETN